MSDDGTSDPSSAASSNAVTAADRATVPVLPAQQSLPSASYRALPHFSFPAAAQPEIVRAYQKDVYYRDLLRSQLADGVRAIFGTRVLQARADTLSIVASVAYYAITSLGGAQTLGEEYVNAMMTDSRTGRIVRNGQRALFIVLHVLSPYLLSSLYSRLRKWAQRQHALNTQAAQRAQLRAQALRSAHRGSSGEAVATSKPNVFARATAVLSERLPALEELTASDGWLAYAGAAHLALFYLGGRFYGVGQRIARVEYISTISRRPGGRPPSYEVLGSLLGFQLLVKLLQSLNRWRLSRKEAREAALKASRENNGSDEKGEDEDDHEVTNKDGETVCLDDRKWTHKTSPASQLGLGSRDESERDPGTGAAAPLHYADPSARVSDEALSLGPHPDAGALSTLHAAAAGRAAELENIAQGSLRCTLCMEQRTPERGTSAVTECGHVFCWECIVGWIAEKPECPLCRQSVAPNRILPIYNF